MERLFNGILVAMLGWLLLTLLFCFSYLAAIA